MKIKGNLKDKALKKYLASNGEITLTALGKDIGVSKNTLCKWRRKYNWDAKLAESCQLVNEQIIEHAAADRVGHVIRHFEKNEKQLAMLDDAIINKLYQRNADGEIMKDADGQPIRDPNLRPLDIQALVNSSSKIAESRTKIMAALGINPQEGQAKDSSRFTTYEDGDTPGYVDEVIQRIIKTGDVEGQAQLMRVQDSVQRLLEVGKK